MDVSKEMPVKIHIQSRMHHFFQNVVYEDVPPFCATCCILGHKIGDFPKASTDIPKMPDASKLWKPKTQVQVTEHMHPHANLLPEMTVTNDAPHVHTTVNEQSHPTFNQNLELLGRVTDDIQHEAALDDNPHFSSVSDTEHPPTQNDTGATLQDLKSTFIQESEAVKVEGLDDAE